MSDTSDDSLDRGRVDLVPMIDCIMLLLLFFMMTTKFTAEEQRLSSLLPTDQGAGDRKTLELPRQINLTVVPAGADPALDAAALQRGLIDSPRAADLRIGNRDPLRLHGDGSDLEAIHRYVAEALAPYEIAGAARTEQLPIDIHCFSGMPWRHALAAYDAVRGYELAKGSQTIARSVSMAPPRIRDATPTIRGEELWEILHLRPGG